MYTVIFFVLVLILIGAQGTITRFELRQDDSGRFEWDSQTPKYVYNETDKVKILCDVSGEPPPRVQWRRIESDGSLPANGLHVNEDDPYNPWLRIYNVQKDHRGKYRCRAENMDNADVEEKEIEIYVQYKPIITVRKKYVRGAEGDYIDGIECFVDAYPIPQYTWMKGSEVLFGNRQPIATSSRSPRFRLVILSVIPKRDYGNYTCIALNIAGNDSGTIELSGRPRTPRVLSPPQGLRKHEYMLTWDYGTIQPDDHGFISVNDFVILFRGWWIEDTVRKVYTNEFHLDMQIQPTSLRQLPLSIELTNLRDNIDYEVKLYGINDYGIGSIAHFNFTTPDRNLIDRHDRHISPKPYSDKKSSNMLSTISLLSTTIITGNPDDRYSRTDHWNTGVSLHLPASYIVTIAVLTIVSFSLH